MSALILWINIPLMVLAFGLWVSIPIWLVLHHPDVHPKQNRSLPAYRMSRQRAARAQVPARAYAAGRGLASL